MKRVISQIGDSTDGEDQEKLEETLYDNSVNYINKLAKYNSDTLYVTSYIFKDLGNRILQDPKVRTVYKGIKQSLVPKEKLDELQPLDVLLGRGWGTIISGYSNEENRKLDKILEDQLAAYYALNKNMVDRICSSQQIYNDFKTDAERANYYLKEVVNIKDVFKQIYKLNKEIEQYSQSQREVVELFSNKLNIQEEYEDATVFLAKIKASKKLDKDLGKNYLYDNKYGSGKTIGDNSIAKKTTQKDETLEIHTAGGFKHYTTDEGSYANIGARLKEYIDNEFIDSTKLKQFLQSSIRGKINSDIILDNELLVDLLDQLQTLVKLMFGIEIKRNTAALLTNAMFFDLVDEKIYELKDIAKELPVAMEDAVPASTTIDKKVGKYLTSISEYDYRDREEPSKAKILAARDKVILKDWLLYKLKINLHKEIEHLNKDSTIQNFEDRGFETNIANKEKVINNIIITFKQEGNKFNLQLEWYKPLKGQEKYRVKLCEVQEVNAKVFYELINEWYGIKIPYLNGIIKLKAAGDKKDEINPDINNSKMLIEESKYDSTRLLNSGPTKIYVEDSDKDLVTESTTTKKLFTEKGIFNVSKELDQNSFDFNKKRESKGYDKMLQRKKEKEFSIEEKIYNTILEHREKISNPNELYNIFAGKHQYKDIVTQIKSIPGYYDDNEMFARIIQRYIEECSHSLKGSGEFGEEKDIGYINSYFGKYTLDALDYILHFRINDLQLKDVKILQSIFIEQDYNNISNILAQISTTTEQTTLVPLNLFNKHAVGLIFQKDQANNIVIVKYIDSLNKEIPQELKQLNHPQL